MKVSYSWLKEYVDKLPRPEKLADLLTIHSFEVKSIEKIKNDYVFDIDVLPNRAHDCLSHVGIARECAALLKSKIKNQKSKVVEDKKTKTADFIKIEVQDKDACPRYVARVIDSIKISPSPKWLKERLEVIGQKSINNVVDATNYVMFETGQPLHVFDYEKISRPESGQGSGVKPIIVRTAKKGEKITTLDNENLELDENVLVIADSKSPLALAGVKGGKKAEITNKTKIIVLESANFNYQTIRKTFRKTGIKTESSIRFEHEIDPNLAEQSINRVASLIQDIAGGKIAKNIIDVYYKKVFPKTIKINPAKFENVLGIKISKQEIIKRLKSLGLNVDSSLKVKVPTERLDIKIEEDLIEEVARLVGYNNIHSRTPFGLIGISRVDEILIIVNKIKNIFETLGFVELYNFSFVGEDDLNKFKIKKDNYIELENPLSQDLKYLQKDLLVNLLKKLKENSKSHLGAETGIKIYELGTVYRTEKNKTKEERMISGIIASKSEKMKGEKFYELKGAIDMLFNKLGIAECWYDDFEATPEWTDDIFWQKGSSAEIKINGTEIGFLGKVNSEILNSLNIKGVVAAFNLNFELMLKLVREELIYEPPSLYPAAIRDLSVLVDKTDRVTDVLNVIETVGGELVIDVDMFDMYEGESVSEDKKSLAFHIIFQSYEKTLKDEEVDKIFRKIIKELENKNWEVRR
jgi:phenylalanyl-tRNA synthetase beta chain